MNFFEQQDLAHRKTRWLVVLLTIAVLALIVVTVLAISLILYFSQHSPISVDIANSIHTPFTEHLRRILASEMVFWVAGGIVLLVTGGSFYKSMQLGGSGRKVAEALGGRLINPGSTKPDERKILNVVEEMAIASGNPVPPVYLLDETSINAFAAGSDRQTAVIGITKGCISTLNREELQGVVAHEFSHIHFGDMRLNLRLVGILHGILLIGLIGSHLLRSGSFHGGRRNRGGQVGAGLVLVILGYVGVFFGNIIKAAVSRQREFLADASAAQFTRNPTGIANALKKIGRSPDSSILTAPAAPQFNHFYFGQGLASPIFGLLATHPPLGERIKRLEPHWDGQFQVPTSPPSSVSEAETAIQNSNRQAGMPVLAGMAAVEAVGRVDTGNIASAHNLIEELGTEIHEAAHEPFSARALIYGLLIDRKQPAIRQQQLEYLQQRAHPATYQTFQKLLGALSRIERRFYLPILELAMPALKLQSPPQYSVFKNNVKQLIEIDRRVTLPEWCILRSITAGYEEKPVQASKYLRDLTDQVSIIITAISRASDPGDISARLALAEPYLGNITLKPQEGNIGTRELDEALDALAQLKPLEKPKLLKAIAACINADNRISVQESEFFRAVADSLNCPVPLFQVVAKPAES